MENSPRLNMPYLAASQAQKHVTHNEALRVIDCLLHLTLKDKNIAMPPTDPGEGDCYFVAAGATDEWSTKEGMLACYQDGAWVFHQPKTGYTAWIEDESEFVVWSDDSWQTVSTATEFALLGINTNADLFNRLAVKSAAILFDHDGAGTQVKLNKSSTLDVSSILFQTNYSGRAELGTVGSDDLQLKTSIDGGSWMEAITVSSASGKVTFPNTPEINQVPRINLFSDGGRFAGAPESQSLNVGAYQTPGYLQSYNNSIFSEGPAFINDNSTHGGSGAALDPVIDALISGMRSGGGTALQYGPEFYTLDVTAGNDTNLPLTHLGTTYYPSLRNGPNPLPPNVTLGYWLFVTSGSALLNSISSNRLYLNSDLESAPVELGNSDGWHHVSRIIDLDANDHHGYYRDMFQIYATPGSQFLLAVPFLFFGHVSPQSIYKGGCNPSIASW